MSEEKIETSTAELVELVTQLQNERDTLKGSLDEVQAKVTELTANEVRLNKIVASTVLSSKPIYNERNEKSFDEMYVETLKEMRQ